jgi:hypothetical protein
MSPLTGHDLVAYTTADEGLSLSAFAAAPRSASADALNLLASWAATPSRPGTDSEHAREHHRG